MPLALLHWLIYSIIGGSDRVYLFLNGRHAIRMDGEAVVCQAGERRSVKLSIQLEVVYCYDDRALKPPGYGSANVTLAKIVLFG
jgi:hypothetical protein